MLGRFGLPVLCLFVTGSITAGSADEGVTAATGTAPLASREEGCEPGELKPVLTVPGEYFEALVATKNGDIYSQAGISGDVYRIRPSGSVSVVATIPYGCGDNSDYYCGNLGMAEGPTGDVWIAEVTFIPDTHGVWRLHRDGTAELAVALSPDQVPIPNTPAFDRHGNMYVDDTVMGTIWKAAPGDHVATLWLTSPLLAPPEGGTFGANGMVYRKGALYVANTDQGTIVRIPVNRDGSPGDPRVFSSGLAGPDNLSLDRFGDLYVVTAYGAQIIRILDNGEPEILVEHGLTYPTNVDFGLPRRGKLNAFVTDYFPVYGAPNIYEIDLCPRQRWINR